MSKDTEGLIYLYWSDFDSPDEPGSGYKFMEREPVLMLDRAIHNLQRKPFTKIVRGYVSANRAKRLGLEVHNSHRVGQAILLRCPDAKKKHDLCTQLFQMGVHRLAIQGNGLSEYLYFDMDTLKERGMFSWNMNIKDFET